MSLAGSNIVDTCERLESTSDLSWCHKSVWGTLQAYLLQLGGIPWLPDELEEGDDKREAETADEDVEDSRHVAQRQRARLRLNVTPSHATHRH